MVVPRTSIIFQKWSDQWVAGIADQRVNELLIGFVSGAEVEFVVFHNVAAIGDMKLVVMVGSKRIQNLLMGLDVRVEERVGSKLGFVSLNGDVRAGR